MARLADTLVDVGTLPSSRRLAYLESWENAIFSKTRDELNFSDFGGLSQEETQLLQKAPEILRAFRNLEDVDRLLIEEVLSKLFSGMKMDLRPTEVRVCHSFSELDRYCYLIAGCVGEFWVKILKLDNELISLAINYGKALQMINIYRDAPRDALIPRIYFPPDAEDNWENFRLEYFRILKSYLFDAEKFVNQITKAPWRVRLASAIPYLIACDTYQLLQTKPLQGSLIKVKRRQVRLRVLEAFARSLIRAHFYACRNL